MDSSKSFKAIYTPCVRTVCNYMMTDGPRRTPDAVQSQERRTRLRRFGYLQWSLIVFMVHAVLNNFYENLCEGL